MNVFETSIKIIISKVSRILDVVYKKILFQTENQVCLRKLLHIIVDVKTYFSLAEINIILHIDNIIVNFNFFKRQCELSLGMENFIKNFCEFFVRISSFRVYFVHQITKEFLVQEQKFQKVFSSKWKHSLTSIESNLIIAPNCIWYILLAEFDISWIKFSNKNKQKTSLRLSRYLKNHEFLDYAFCHWITHFTIAFLFAHDSLTANAREFCRMQTSRFRTWYKVYWSFLNRKSFRSYINLREAAAFNFFFVVKIIVNEDTDFNVANEDSDTSLHIACMHKRYNFVRYFIEQKTAIDIVAHDDNVALFIVATFDLTQIVKLLIRRKVEVNSQNKKNKTPLDRAYEFGQAECVEKLLEFDAVTNVKSYANSIINKSLLLPLVSNSEVLAEITQEDDYRSPVRF